MDGRSEFWVETTTRKWLLTTSEFKVGIGLITLRVNVENAWCVIKQNYYLREMKSVFNDGH